MGKVVVEVGDQVRPNDVYVRVSGEETRVTVNREPEAEVLATLRGDIVDVILDALEANPQQDVPWQYEATLEPGGGPAPTED
jgi:hypothetical protein